MLTKLVCWAIVLVVGLLIIASLDHDNNDDFPGYS
jgi:hypothetical protein